MKKLLSLILALLFFVQIEAISFAFTDSNASPFTGKYYTHDDKFKNYEIINGLDISHYQTDANFTKLKKAGVNFVILRAAYRGWGSGGSLNKDTKFDTYAPAAIKAGMDVGAYIFSQAITVSEAQAEADYIMDIAKKHELTLPLVFDYEYGPSGTRLAAAKLTKKQKTDICIAFCKRVESKGYTAMVYANQSMLTGDLDDDTIAKDYDIWLANYNSKPYYQGKFYDCDYHYWQYSSTGKASGVSGNIDCNFRYYKKPEKLKNLVISSETAEKTVLKWDKIKGVYGYSVYRLDAQTNTYKRLDTVKGASKTSYSDKTTAGGSYTYKVRAILAHNGSFAGGTFSDTVTSSGVFKVSATSSLNSNTLTWSSLPNATEYIVLRGESSDGTDLNEIAKCKKSVTTYEDLKADTFKTYYYQIKAYEGTEGSYTSSTIITAKKPQPSIDKVYLKTNSSAIISWNKIDGATGTEIWRKSGSESYKLIKTINNNTTTEYLNKKLKSGVTYKYKIRQFVTRKNTANFSSKTACKSVKTLAKAQVTAKAYKTKIKISVKKVSDAKGYEYYLKVGKDYILQKRTSKTSYTKKNLAKNKKYTFKVRAYKKSNGEYIYAPCTKITVKTTK